MNDHPDPADALMREHPLVWATLPWVANGTASAEQHRVARAHLAGCADCRRELEAQQRLLQAVAEAQPSQWPDAEAGLSRLLARLETPAEDPLSTPGVSRGAHRESRRLTVALAAAVVVQAIGLGVLGLALLQDPHGADYRTLAQPPAATPPPARVQVVPSMSMTLADWQRLLESQHLRVVDGPNAAGAYRLAPSEGALAPSGEALAARLRGVPGVRLAEPVDGAR